MENLTGTNPVFLGTEITNVDNKNGLFVKIAIILVVIEHNLCGTWKENMSIHNVRVNRNSLRK